MEAAAVQMQQHQEEGDVEEQPGPWPVEKLQVRFYSHTSASKCYRLEGEVTLWCCVTQELGIAAADIKKLKDGGIHTVEAVAHQTKKDLCAIKGLSEAKVAKMQQEGRYSCGIYDLVLRPSKGTMTALIRDFFTAWKLVPMGFTTASVVAEQRGDIIQITTGAKELDTILEGTGGDVGWLVKNRCQVMCCMIGVCMDRGAWDRFNHRALWRVPMWEDTAMPYSLCYMPGDPVLLIMLLL
jgi:hypothetical protein